MKIDGNELAIEQNELDREGRHAEAMAIKREFLKQVRESGDHCPCKQACPHHGNCFECVTLHRGHRDHLPMCLLFLFIEGHHTLPLFTVGPLGPFAAAPRFASSTNAPVPIGTGALLFICLQSARIRQLPVTSGLWPVSSATKSVSSPAALTAASSAGIWSTVVTA